MTSYFYTRAKIFSVPPVMDEGIFSFFSHLFQPLHKCGLECAKTPPQRGGSWCESRLHRPDLVIYRNISIIQGHHRALLLTLLILAPGGLRTSGLKRKKGGNFTCGEG
ncbi:unnamed protein product, partial [Pleuronectes platessa]